MGGGELWSPGEGKLQGAGPTVTGFLPGASAVAVRGVGCRADGAEAGAPSRLLQGFARKGPGEDGALQRTEVSTEFPGAPGLSAACAEQGSQDGQARLRRG